ncbi:hypothetical protein AUR04nite_16790 [Glutamicibacter uratoxydans]|uniref:Lipopolysaccharide assembly protein A domain-containing protein n=1 Tax=Glutamicibacter uratoxydans TaxID=43667 RepID=A0A4Y4DNF9_GLUUR|nr:LapA family protein [Glutamicibacter uratoxydans]GED06147.1 hypothetical protein AUR04nite_16790 [Glutamicibacter uratoxydans]
MTQKPAGGAGFFTTSRVLAIILAIIALVFIFSNTQMATLNLIGIKITMPGWLWFFGLLVVGFVIGSMTPWFQSKKK